ncbi:hypothetical protein BN7_4517 [Wickerhamomyces ciferrii]|uniref:Uncharacterized protein n=1 Tax=Wickerhamomyces ciferrii (strain ATCC 14091 / BCRC 22168 / CBS 111 / JCM 3599 / NBRC 0793 / NRRL Y-1031 F-60-10) TaxID=1206466 RepID=K0KSE7_WICCF|nr:uncharacterized protein BN7_4517 [Wickerhamomyces ciferrii]CCH44947.1 hypothetical protein BN7_4517 [Wickerhamomyces ciferrii]
MQRRKAQPIVVNKEDGNFREALKLYESKQYKKSLKLTDGILKKNSNYSEGLALKALLLHCLNEKNESEIYVNRAITKNEDSPVGNHILGILRRVQQDYRGAAHHFKKALDNGSTNKQIWRDLSVMEVQNRDYSSLAKSRHAYLEEFLGYRANWTGLAVAHELNNDFGQAEKVLTKFEELATDKLTEAEMYEHSELQLYKNHIIAKQDIERALKDLNKLDTFDKLDELELRATYLMKLGKSKEASKVYRELLKRNPDNIKYYTLLEVSLGTLNKSGKFRDSLYQKLAKFYPKSDPPAFIPLTFLKSQDSLFKLRVEEYLLKNLKRGVPATFTNVKPLYKDQGKISIIEEIVLKFLEKSSEISPIVYVWTNYFLSQHFLYKGELSKAKNHIDLAINHTPTLVELYILKARVLKHYGEFIKAAEVINEGRLLDLQDRFINSKTVKYYLRADLIDKAYETVSIFTKNDNSVNGVKDLHLMQASWFIIENGESFARLSEKAESLEESKRFKGLALKRFQAIVKIFEEYYNDQLDFHTFCLRKGTARSYIKTLKWEDQIFSSPVYMRAVLGASKIYFNKFDNEKDQVVEDDSVEVKKNDKKAKKDKIAKQKALESERVKHIAYTDDDDVFGELLIDSKTPLDDFQNKFFNHLLEQGSDKIITNDLQYNLQFRLKKVALAIGALGKLKKLTNDQYELIPAYVLNLKNNCEKGISSILAEKGIEKNFNIDFNKVDEFIDKYTQGDSIESTWGLVELYKLKLESIDNELILSKIEKKLTKLQPYEVLLIKSVL